MNVWRREPGWIHLCLPVHVGDLIFGPKIRARVAVAFKTPAHGDRLVDTHDLHFVYAAVTRRTSNADRKVRAVIEVRVFRKLVDFHPLYGFARIPTRHDVREPVGIRFHNRMAAHTGLCRRDHRMRRFFNVRVTIAAIDAHHASVKPVAVGNRLNRRVAHLQVLWGEVVPDDKGDACQCDWRDDTQNQREFIERTWKELHCSGLEISARRNCTTTALGAVYRRRDPAIQ